MQNKSLNSALQSDPMAKAWICANEPLFINSQENSDIFLTTYRIRNAYEDLLNRLSLNENVQEGKDMVLIKRLFEMSFYPPKSLSLTAWKEGKDDKVRILNASKDRRWKGNRRRPYEITLNLDNGKRYQINPNEILSRFFTIRRNLDTLTSSAL